MYLFMAALCLHCYVGAFSSCSEQGLLSSCGARASLVVEHRALGCTGFGSCGACA